MFTALDFAKEDCQTEIVELLTRAAVRARRTQRPHTHVYMAGEL
jgi:hypothetical protein